MDSIRLTMLLDKAYGGDRGAFGRVAELVYEEFRAIARKALAERSAGVADVGPTMIANDALMELMKQREAIANSDQFFALATRFMFRIISHMRRDASAQIRGGGRSPLELDPSIAGAGSQSDSDLNELEKLRIAMEELHTAHAEAAEVVTLHIWGGLPLARVSELTGIPQRTVERRWKLARAFLAERFGVLPDA